MHIVYHAVFLGLLRCHPVVAVGVRPHLVIVGMRMLGDDGIELLLELHYLAGLYLYVGSLSLHSAERLVYHHAAVRQRAALALLACHEKHRRHGSRHACADSGNVARDKLHGVVYPETSRDTSARRIDVYGDILVRVAAVKVQQLRLQGVCRIVVDLRAEEYDAVHHQSREDIHLRHIKLTLLEDVRVHILAVHIHRRLALEAHDIIYKHTVHAQMLGCVFSEIVVHL